MTEKSPRAKIGFFMELPQDLYDELTLYCKSTGTTKRAICIFALRAAFEGGELPGELKCPPIRRVGICLRDGDHL